jgi:hypothetical protein
LILEYRNQKGKADLLVSLDKKHLLDKPELAALACVEIVTSFEAIANLRKRNNPKRRNLAFGQTKKTISGNDLTGCSSLVVPMVSLGGRVRQARNRDYL